MLQKMYEGRHVLLAGKTGSWLYNLQHKDSDEDYKAFVAPTIDDLVKGYKVQRRYELEGAELELKDFRELVSLIEKQNPTALEVLFADGVRAHNEPFQKFQSLRHELVRMDLRRLYGSSLGTANNRINRMEKLVPTNEHLFEEYGYDTKSAMHALRTLDFLIRYHEKGFTCFRECIRYESGTKMRGVLHKLRFGHYTLEEAKALIAEKMAVVEALREDYCSQKRNEETFRLLEEAVSEVVKYYVRQELAGE